MTQNPTAGSHPSPQPLMPERGNYRPVEGSYADGSEYRPLQTDGHDVLCPECGGYGHVPSEKGFAVTCTFCNQGYIPLDDNRVHGLDDQKFVHQLTQEIVKADFGADHQEDLKKQIVALVGDHGHDLILARGLQAMKEEDRIVLSLADPVSMDSVDDLMERTAPRFGPGALAITSMYAAMAALDMEKQRERERARQFAMERRRDREELHRQVQEDNYNQALQLLQDTGKRLRWTQISSRLNPISLRGVKTALKNHPNIVFTKNGKRVFVEWKD